MASRNAELRSWRHSNKSILGELNNLVMGSELKYNATSLVASNGDNEPTYSDNSSEQDSEPSEVDGDISPISSQSDFNHEASDCDTEQGKGLHDIPMSTVLSSWVTTHRITQRAVCGLLGILRTYGCDVPKDSMTLLKTPRCVATDAIYSGSYIYLRIEQGIKRIISSKIYSGNTISLIINIDGLPLYKSSSIGVWPILARFGDLDPFIVALYCGEGKPANVNEYLKDFCEEAERLKQDGLQHANVNYAVSVWIFTCDAPARSFVKCIKSHTGYYSCERCQVEGEYEGRVVFHNLQSDMRTDADFSGMKYDDHQMRKSILIDYGYPCVTGFVLDYMHLVLLGVMRKMLNFLMSGPLLCRLSSVQVNQISTNLDDLKGKMPTEFARQPRSLKYLPRYKSTELRNFLLYSGIFMLRGVVKDDIYEHFLCLSVSIRILLQARSMSNDMIQYARSLLHYYVSKAESIYGRTFTTYNVHNLVHLTDDILNHGVGLHEISAFPFENYMQVIKKFVRNAKNPIAQIVKRLYELENSGGMYSKKEIHTKVSPTNGKDNWFLTKDGCYVCVQTINDGPSYVCSVVKRKDVQNYFTEPCQSTILQICRVKKGVQMKRRSFTFNELDRKLACFSSNDCFVLIPLCHECM